MSTTMVSVTREMLSGGTLVGQCDKKFILTSAESTGPDGPRSFLLAFDQHAADERVNLERLITAALATRSQACVAINQTVSVAEEEAFILQHRVSLFLEWGFEYFITVGGTGQEMSDSRQRALSLTVVQVPSIHSEPLSVQDLLEFVQYVSEHAQSPDSILRPPAFMRVLASQACHGAIRFGDELNHSQCETLLKNLTNTTIPFQCAHGRPSVAPLLDLTVLTANKARLSENRRNQTAKNLKNLLSRAGLLPSK
jgi:DNA mismatch repair protein MLH3